MKKFAIITGLIFFLLNAMGQRSIDRLFDKYSDRDGFTCITLSGDILNIAADFEDEGRNRDIKATISEVRILAQKDHHFEIGNFHDIIMKDLDRGDYEEFLSVKENDHDMKVLVRSQGRRITELLMIAGGDDNAVIQVKGNMSVSDARKLCDRHSRGSDIF
jgi:hypothetical protein